ncbi:hypothetical protein X474_04785 [Dethiosulfatarculus sandiegensis]|uniref:Uncharacterized protein n=1 Tax=Dethiosulfatarculus sandiegensis TaxID=1429043 RepID=A0A0D2HY16_9BACT|nr:hypothetical protein X474_04785 [Dethiosulfatarculus sandiegensis]
MLLACSFIVRFAGVFNRRLFGMICRDLLMQKVFKVELLKQVLPFFPGLLGEGPPKGDEV